MVFECSSPLFDSVELSSIESTHAMEYGIVESSTSPTVSLDLDFFSTDDTDLESEGNTTFNEDNETESDSSTAPEVSELRESFLTTSYQDSFDSSTLVDVGYDIPGTTGGGQALSTSKEPLYEGATITTMESNLALFQYAIRHGLSGKAFNELLLLFAAHLPEKNRLSLSVYRLKKCFAEHFSSVKATSNYYCSVCLDFLENGSEPCEHDRCITAGSCIKEFVSIPLASQVRKVMEGQYIIIYML